MFQVTWLLLADQNALFQQSIVILGILQYVYVYGLQFSFYIEKSSQHRCSMSHDFLTNENALFQNIIPKLNYNLFFD